MYDIIIEAVNKQLRELRKHAKERDYSMFPRLDLRSYKKAGKKKLYG